MNVLDRLLVSIPNYSKIRITYGIDPEIAYLRNEYVYGKIVSIKNLLTGTKFHFDIIRLKWVNEFKQHVLPLLKPVKLFRRLVTFKYKGKSMQTYVECIDYIAIKDVIKKVLIELEEKCNLRTVKSIANVLLGFRKFKHQSFEIELKPFELIVYKYPIKYKLNSLNGKLKVFKVGSTYELINEIKFSRKDLEMLANEIRRDLMTFVFLVQQFGIDLP